MDNTCEKAGSFGATGFKTSVPTVADTVPPKFRQALIEASLCDAEWLRLPPPRGRCRLTGLSRSTLLELGARRLIRVVRLRKPGATRGIVLVQKESLLNYIRDLPSGDKLEGNAK